MRIRIILVTQRFYGNLKEDFKFIGNYLHLLYQNHFHIKHISVFLGGFEEKNFFKDDLGKPQKKLFS